MVIPRAGVRRTVYRAIASAAAHSHSAPPLSPFLPKEDEKNIRESRNKYNVGGIGGFPFSRWMRRALKRKRRKKNFFPTPFSLPSFSFARYKISIKFQLVERYASLLGFIYMYFQTWFDFYPGDFPPLQHAQTMLRV